MAEENVAAGEETLPDDQPVEGQEAVTPEEQEAYERTVLAGIKAISDPASNPKIMEMLGSGGDPAKLLASTTSAIFSQLEEQSGGTIPEVVIMPAAAEILQNVAEFARESGAIPVDANMQNKAAQYLVTDLAEAYDLTPEDAADLMNDMGEGEIGSIVDEQNAIAESGAPVEEAAPAAAAPAQALPGIINQTIGG